MASSSRPAMPDQSDAEIRQILGRHARQHPFVDLVLTERRLVLLELQLPQPRRYVHAVILGSEKRQPLKDDDKPLPFEPTSGGTEIERSLGFWCYGVRGE